MRVKIGRYEYDLKNGDKFLDNGACVQLMTQSKEKCFEFSTKRPWPQVSKKTWKDILANCFYEKKPHSPEHTKAYLVVYVLKHNKEE